MTKPMPSNEFHGRYANLSISKRGMQLEWLKHGFLTMSDIYRQINKLGTEKAQIEDKEKKLLKIAAEYMPLLEKNG